MKEVDWTKYGDARKQEELASVGEHIRADGEDEMQDAAGASGDKGRDRLNEPVVGKVETDPERATEGEPKLNAPESLNNAPVDASKNSAVTGPTNRHETSCDCWSEIHERGVDG